MLTYLTVGCEAGLCGFAGVQVFSSSHLTLCGLVLHDTFS